MITDLTSSAGSSPALYWTWKCRACHGKFRVHSGLRPKSCDLCDSPKVWLFSELDFVGKDVKPTAGKVNQGELPL